MAMKLKRITPIVEDNFGVCLWMMPDGAFLGDDEGRFLSMSGHLYDRLIEAKMEKAAVHYLGLEAIEGRPQWMPGSRKISDDEADSQKEKLLEGRVPDEVDYAKQILRGVKK
jgi:hypothetical protein